MQQKRQYGRMLFGPVAAHAPVKAHRATAKARGKPEKDAGVFSHMGPPLEPKVAGVITRKIQPLQAIPKASYTPKSRHASPASKHATAKKQLERREAYREKHAPPLRPAPPTVVRRRALGHASQIGYEQDERRERNELMGAMRKEHEARRADARPRKNREYGMNAGTMGRSRF